MLRAVFEDALEIALLSAFVSMIALAAKALGA
jgi:hypothetical protein